MLSDRSVNQGTILCTSNLGAKYALSTPFPSTKGSARFLISILPKDLINTSARFPPKSRQINPRQPTVVLTSSHKRKVESQGRKAGLSVFIKFLATIPAICYWAMAFSQLCFPLLFSSVLESMAYRREQQMPLLPRTPPKLGYFSSTRKLRRKIALAELHHQS